VDEKIPFSILTRDVNNLLTSCQNLLKNDTQNKNMKMRRFWKVSIVKNEKQKK
jgi:hypothetical protein